MSANTGSGPLPNETVENFLTRWAHKWGTLLRSDFDDQGNIYFSDGRLYLEIYGSLKMWAYLTAYAPNRTRISYYSVGMQYYALPSEPPLGG